MKPDILKQFNLPSYLKGKTFAEASKAINDKFKGRNDKVSKDTRNELLMRLAKAQESIKAEQGITNPQEQMFFGGDMPEPGMEGGTAAGVNPVGMAGTAFDLASPFIKDGVGKTAASGALKGASAGAMLGPIGAGVGAVIGGVSGFASGQKAKEEAQDSLNTNTLKNNSQYASDFGYGGKMYPMGGPGDPKPKFYSDPFAVEGIKTNLDTNFSVPPLSDLINPRVPSANESGRRMPTTINVNPALLTNKRQLGPVADETYTSYINNFYPSKLGELSDPEFYQDPFSNIGLNIPKGEAMNAGNVDIVGGKLGKPGSKQTSGSGKGSSGRTPETKVEGITRGPKNTSITGGNPYKIATTELPGDEGNGLGNIAGKAGKFLKNNYADILRYAPVLANAKQLADLEKPAYERLDRLSNRYQKDLVDEESLRRNVQQQADNTRNAIMGASAGSLGAVRSNLLGSQINATRGTSDAMMQAENINRGENRMEQEFNMNVDATNIRQANLENDINARNQGVYDTNKSQLISQLGNDIGNIGREEKFKQMVKEMGICYDSRGRYICGTEERVPDNYQGTTDQAYGGLSNDDLFSDYLSKVLAKKRNK